MLIDVLWTYGFEISPIPSEYLQNSFIFTFFTYVNSVSVNNNSLVKTTVI